MKELHKICKKCKYEWNCEPRTDCDCLEYDKKGCVCFDCFVKNNANFSKENQHFNRCVNSCFKKEENKVIAWSL